jgi:hypothetical protein
MYIIMKLVERNGLLGYFDNEIILMIARSIGFKKVTKYEVRSKIKKRLENHQPNRWASASDAGGKL